MREILFRGKRLDDGEWVFGYYFPVCRQQGKMVRARYYIIPVGCEFQSDLLQDNAVEVDPATVGQYTGLTDRNGRRIFEGDIVRYVYEPGEGFWNANQNSVIEWKGTGFYMDGIKGTNKYALMSGWLTTIPFGEKNFEIIGNIHDNPELLESGAQK